jgi:SAM-dependent methyltransferase
VKNKKIKVNQEDKWNSFHAERVQKNYLKWPNEPMVKTIFGKYLSDPVKPNSSWKILDVGCGFGNNLTPFADIGCECHGVEIHPDICTLTESLLSNRGYKAKIKYGSNRELPYEDGYFDLLLSVATIHYEGTESNVLNALREFRRVVKPGGLVYVATAGPCHDIYTKAKLLGNHRYQIQDYDFRNGEEFFFFDNKRYFESYLLKYFNKVEVGQITENLFDYKVDHLIALCR